MLPRWRRFSTSAHRRAATLSTWSSGGTMRSDLDPCIGNHCGPCIAKHWGPCIGKHCGFFWTWHLFFSQCMPLPHRTQRRTPGSLSKTLARLKKPSNCSRRSRLWNFVGEILTIGHILQELKGHAAAKAQGQNNKRTYAKVLLLLMSNWSCWFPFTRRLRGDRLKSLRTKPPEWRWSWHWYCFS